MVKTKGPNNGCPTNCTRSGGSGVATLDTATRTIVAPFVEKAALTLSINEAWLVIAIFTAVVLALLPLVRSRHAQPDRSSEPFMSV